jgi:sugar phosphate isomerase/epimerase
MLPVWLTDTVTSDLNRALHYTKLWGLEGVELRTVGGADDRVPDVNEQQIRDHLDPSDLLVAGIVPRLFEGPVSDRAAWMNDLLQFDDTLAFCNRIRCPRVVVSPFAAEETTDVDAVADALRRAGDKAADYDVLLAVRNGPETTHPTGLRLAELLALVDHPHVRAAWNPVGALRAGEDPAEGLSMLADRVSLVRCGDGRIEGGTWEDLPFGEGTIDWTTQLRLLHDAGFQGPLSLELYVEPRPKHGLRAATTLIRMVRQVLAS